MKTFRVIFGICLVLVVSVFPAWAAPRTFVSGKGSNTNACSLTAPCRTFAKAVSKTDSGGEVVVLNSAEYGPVTITKSISIIAPQGLYAAIAVLSGNGITINAGTSVVALKGLSIVSQGGDNGIQSNAVDTLFVENCSVSGFDSFGIEHLAPDSNLIVRNSVLRNNQIGIRIDNTSGTVQATIDRTCMDLNWYGFELYPNGSGAANATISNSTANNSTTAGFVNYSVGQGHLHLESCVASNSITDGIYMASGSPNSTVISNCTISNNARYGVDNLGIVYTMSNNKLTGNGWGDVYGTLTPYPQQ
jgi:hypothetical protein